MGDDEDELDVNELFDSLLGEPLSNSEDLQSFCNALNGCAYQAKPFGCCKIWCIDGARD
jgi:hypothetical protein